MEIEGNIIQELAPRQGEGKNGPWRSQTYVLETIESYPKRVAFDVFDGQTGRIERLGIRAGKRMRVFFDIDAHEYNGRWFNTVRAYDAREV